MQELENIRNEANNPADRVITIKLENMVNDRIISNDTLKKILGNTKKVNFYEKVYPEYYQKSKAERARLTLTAQHYLVVSIEEVLRIAKSLDLGLCKQDTFIYAYDGSYWLQIDKDSMKSFLGLCAQKMGINQYESKYFHFRDNLFKQFMTLAYLPAPKRTGNNVLINLSNGTFEFDGELQMLRSYKREDFLKYKLPFEYDDNASAPMFQKFLDEVLPHKCMQDVMSEFVASVFMKDLKLEKAMLMYGTGANGKSVFFEIMMALLGRENVTNYSISSLTSNTSYQRAMLANTLLNYASEIGTRMESETFKLLVSGEPVEARLPYGQPFIMYDYGRLMFNCNELPFAAELTHAFFRRFIIIPFEVTIPEEKQDKELADKIIKDELPGIFNWVLHGLERLVKNKKLSPCEKVDNQLKEYKRESDSVGIFLEEEGFVPSMEKYQLVKDLYSEYKQFCMNESANRLRLKDFKTALTKKKFSIERKSKGNCVFVEKKSFS